MKHFYLPLIAFLQAPLLLGHGFGADTLVMLADNTWQQISTVCYRALKKKVAVASYDTTSSFQTTAAWSSYGWYSRLFFWSLPRF